MLIEPAVATNHDAICAVLEEVDRLHVEHTPDVFSARTGTARPMAWLLERTQAPDRVVLVARDDGTIVGVVEVSMKPPRDADGFVPRRIAVIDDVGVRESPWPWYRSCASRSRARMGLGERRRRDPASRLELDDGARRLYERLGYATRGFVMEAPLRDRS